MKKILLTTAFIAAISSISTSAQAYDRDTVVLGIGANNFIHEEDSTLGVYAEYRFKELPADTLGGVGNVSPFVGLDASVEAEIYGYGGVLYDWDVNKNWSIIPSFAIGLYEDGDGRDLGYPIEFRSGIEVDYTFDHGTTIGMQLSHTSNASLGNHNPGTEHLKVTYSFPIN